MPSAGENDKIETEITREISHLKRIVSYIASDLHAARKHVSRFKGLLEEYQEQPQLLDAHLESLSVPLMHILLKASDHVGDVEHFSSTMQVCRMIQGLVHTCGYKTISRFLPNKPPDFERALLLLAHVQTLNAESQIDEDIQSGSWQTCCVLLLWISCLVLIPFELGSIPFPTRGRGDGRDETGRTAVQWILKVVLPYLHDPGPTRYI
jgi:tubulin-specific chaperone D